MSNLGKMGDLKKANKEFNKEDVEGEAFRLVYSEEVPF